MSLLRASDVGIDMTPTFSRSLLFLTLTEQTSTTIAGDFRRTGQPGYVVRFSGVNLGGDIVNGPVTGTLTELRETLNGTFLLEVTGFAEPTNILLPGRRESSQPNATERLLFGDDTVQGGAGDDVLRASFGFNMILGGAGNDTFVVEQSRSTTTTYRFRDEAVVFRVQRGQVDQLSGVEAIRFSDVTVPQSALPAAQSFQYIASYADLVRAYGANEEAGWRHFAGSGFTEGRAVTFSGLSYIASYNDLRAAYGTDAEAGARHYLTSGQAEGRTVNFDGLRYIASHDDLIRILPKTIDAGALHFITSGANEGRGVTFDPLRYLAANLDVARTYGADEARGLDHWLTKGYTENRSTTAFDPAHYLANYADLRAAFGTDQRAATLHWIGTGAAEGRTT